MIWSYKLKCFCSIKNNDIIKSSINKIDTFHYNRLLGKTIKISNQIQNFSQPYEFSYFPSPPKRKIVSISAAISILSDCVVHFYDSTNRRGEKNYPAKTHTHT